MNTHKIQLVGKCKNNKTRLGFLTFVEKKYFSFTPNIFGYKKLRWTYHANGEYTCKNSDKKLFSSTFAELDKITEPIQLYSSAGPISNKNDPRDMKYKKISDAIEMNIDLTKFKQQINFSLFACSPSCITKARKIFSNKNNHKAFTYKKTNPNLVFTFFEAYEPQNHIA